MRKLAWLVIIFFGTILIITSACAAFPDTVRPSVVNFIFMVGGGLADITNQGILTLSSTVAASVTNFILYSLVLVAFGGIFWVGIKKLFWDKPKAWLLRRKQTVMPQKEYQKELSEPELFTQVTSTKSTKSSEKSVEPIIEKTTEEG